MDHEYKRKTLENFKSEVNDFHPLLKLLLPELKDVKSVDYTHGPQEKGADFVLNKFDQTLEELIHIGIIAKLGTIHSDLTEIEKQIGECEMERLSSSGKKKLIISEIWVVTNSKITEGAKERIHHKFKDKNIQFVDYQKLISWIDALLPNFWYSYAPEVGKYLSDIWSKNEELDRQLNLIKASDKNIYIEHDIFEREPEYSRTKAKKRKRIDIFEQIKLKKIVMLEGSMGAGKSKIIRRIINHFAKGMIYAEEKILPVYTTYPELIDKYAGDIEAFLNSKVDKKTREVLSKDNIFLLLIDGVDEKELNVKDQLETLSNVINSIHSNEHFKAFITTRKIVGIKENQKIISKVDIFELDPLSTNKVIEFLNAFCNQMNISKRIIEDIKKSNLFKELPKSPISAILLANLINENSKDLPSNLTELYSKYLELMLGRWDVEKGLQSQKEYEAADNILMNLAEYYINNSLPYISVDEACSFFQSYLAERNMDVSAKNLFEKVISRSGIILRDPYKNIVYFKHKTFCEYYYAKYSLKKKNLIVDARVFDVYWDSIYFFYIGLQKDCSDYLQEIVDFKPKEEAYRWNKIVNMANYFLAGDNTPYRIVSENLHTIIAEAATLYSEIVEKKIQSAFSNLTEITILWFFQMVIRDSYSFEYFKKAIDETNIKLDDSQHLDEMKKIYAFFFVGAIASDLDVKKPFDFLLKKHGKNLPLQISLGLSHEADNPKTHSDLLSRQVKKLKQIMKMDSKANSFAKILYKDPLKIRKITS